MNTWQKIQKSRNFTPSVSQVDDFQVRPFAPHEQKNDFENQKPGQSTATKLNWSFGNIPVSRKEAFSGKNQTNLKSSQEQESDRLFLAAQSVASPVQAKLSIGEAGDKYEQEADRVASQVVEQINAPASSQSTKAQSLQRQKDAEEEELQTKPEITALQRHEDAEEEELQTKPSISELQPEAMAEEEEELQAKSILQRGEAIGGGEASTDLESTINLAKGGGQYLDAGLQQKMGQAMGANFSKVWVHTDAESDQLNQLIQASAFTTGEDLFFRQGEYNPGSRGGQELIAHELTHVVQQSGGSLQRSLINNPRLFSPLTRIGRVDMLQRLPGDDEYAPSPDINPWQEKFKIDHLIPRHIKETKDLENYARKKAADRGITVSSIIDIEAEAARKEIRQALIAEQGNVQNMEQIEFTTADNYYVIECTMDQNTGEATFIHPHQAINLKMQWNSNGYYQIYHYGGLRTRENG